MKIKYAFLDGTVTEVEVSDEIGAVIIEQVHKNGQQKKETSYGRIKETTIGGFFMPRSYRHISQYEDEIIKESRDN